MPLMALAARMPAEKLPVADAAGAGGPLESAFVVSGHFSTGYWIFWPAAARGCRRRRRRRAAVGTGTKRELSNRLATGTLWT
jgi:hypothetical protein